MQKLSDMTTTKVRGSSALLYGPPKSGKTKLAGSLAKYFNLHWFDLENGIETLTHDTTLTQEMKERIFVYSLPDTKVNPVGIDTMMKVLTGNPVKICEKHGKVMCLHCTGKAPVFEFNASALTSKDIIVVDSLSQLSDSAFNQVAGADISPELEWKHYDGWNQRIAMCLSLIQQAPYNTLFIGHAKMLEQADGSEKLCPVGGTKAFSANITRYFAHVIYCETKAGQFRTGSKQNYAANIQIGNRADLDLGKEGTELAHFFLPASERPKAAAAVAATKKVSFGKNQ